MNRILQVTTILFIAAMLVSGCATPATPAPAEPPPAQAPTTAAPAPAVAKPVSMDFVVWSYGIETINDNIKNFQTLNPDITITLKDYSWLDYHDTMVAAFAANNPPYLLYGSDHWLNEWASAGWLAPLDKYCPNVAEYSKEVAPYAREGMTYNGNVYGLSYYADTLDFIYNDALLQKAGFTAAPATLDEVYTQAKELEAKGVNQYPILMRGWWGRSGFPPTTRPILSATGGIRTTRPALTSRAISASILTRRQAPTAWFRLPTG